MLNWVLFKKELKNSGKLFGIFLGVMALYAGMILIMFDPKVGESLNEMAQGMPELFAAFGMASISTTILEFSVNYLYNFLFVVLPAVFIIIIANRMVAGYVQDRSMVYLLATPNSRRVIAATQLRVISILVFLLVALSAVFTWALSEHMFPGELDVKGFVLINVALYGLLFFFIGLCFCFSCIFNDTSKSYGFGAGLIIAFVLIQMVSQVGEKLEFLKYATPLTLFDTQGLMAGDSQSLVMFLALYIAGIALSLVGIHIFSKKDLPL